MTRTALGWLFLLVVGSCSTESRQALPTARLTPCRIEGLRDEARCGSLNVFENRESKLGRKIELHFAVVPAVAASPEADPLFLLLGGPGQSALKSGPGVVQALAEVRQHREIVLVDQRGTGRSNPLACQSNKDKSLAEVFRDVVDLEDVRDCAKKLESDPRHYTTPVAMDDLNEVRKALGYEKINLWGGSYGTRAALVYSRRHPESTRRVILDGVAPTDMKLPLNAGLDAQRTLDLLSAQCEADQACAQRLPNLTGAVNSLLSRLREQPETVTIPHPRTGEHQTFAITADSLAAALRAPLYVPGLAALLPLSLAEAAAGRWAPFVALFLTISDGMESDLQVGMFLSVICSEDLDRVSEAELVQHTSGNFLGRSAMDSLQEACELWPHATLPEDYFDPITGAAPTLVLSGELDPVTPPRWGKLIADRLQQAKHVVVNGRGHGVTTVGCVPRAIANFLSSDSPLDVGLECADRLKAPPLFTNLVGSKP